MLQSSDRFHLPAPRRLVRQARRYLFSSAGLLILHLIYAQFSHGVSSPYMTFMFLVPLLLGALPCFLLMYLRPDCVRSPGWQTGSCLYGGGMAAMVNGMMLRGVMDIAGTASPYLILFSLLGGALMIWGILCLIQPLPARATVPDNPFPPQRR